MSVGPRTNERRTSADAVFDHLYERIVSLTFPPGTRMSEADVARQFELSRQPVREAFSRLAALGFLQVRPQRATQVKKFSFREIEIAHFLRTTVEIEIVRHCHVNWCEDNVAVCETLLAAQDEALNVGDSIAYLQADFAFHQALCGFAGLPEVADDIRVKKAMTDRLSIVAFNKFVDMQEPLDEHHEIISALSEPTPDKAIAVMRRHFDRLEHVVKWVADNKPSYFEA